MKYFLILALLVQQGFAQLTPRETRVVGRLQKDLTAGLGGLPHESISAALIKDGRVVWAQAFGEADTSTIYRIGSLTKAFTTVVLMQLVEKGKVSLDDPADKYVPEVRQIPGYTPFTLRQLASHTSGLQREPDLRQRDIGTVDQWENKVLDCLPHTAYAGTPGQQYLYSNIGFAILGLCLERAAGVPYIQLVQDGIFTPLGMQDSYFIMPADKLTRLAPGIANDKDGHVNMKIAVNELKGRGYRVPNGGIFSTPGDLSKFILSLVGIHPVLQASSLRTMRDIPPGGEHYGLGIVVSRGRLNAISHDGSVPGYTSAYMIQDDNGHGYGLILMRNVNAGRTDLALTCREVIRDLAE
ncbi:MAG TPA: serine hydrolase domain-containing protein [Dinghuibacter sp.]|uniref:serine hydrolase domain-containing protein n=1 Tax=Dinghuibacter sp. TaxID=2024697 RepID=UPI002BB90FC2|nr:serine hydrolase domain-containing protein [Dinghuibacter sp.]HTJ11201.1 serine hydrolase domain-containing protein [Dinghuibacter sp.]